MWPFNEDLVRFDFETEDGQESTGEGQVMESTNLFGVAGPGIGRL